MDRIIRPWPILAFVLLGAIWLASFRMADALTFFKTYSSIWFLPTGVTMAIVMVAPGWLKLAPLCANLLLAIPAVRAVVNVEVINDYEPILHGVRLFLVYGGAGYILTRFFRIELPATSPRAAKGSCQLVLREVVTSAIHSGFAGLNCRYGSYMGCSLSRALVRGLTGRAELCSPHFTEGNSHDRSQNG